MWAWHTYIYIYIHVRGRWAVGVAYPVREKKVSAFTQSVRHEKHFRGKRFGTSKRQLLEAMEFIDIYR